MTYFDDWDRAHARRCTAQALAEASAARKRLLEMVAKRRAKPRVSAERLVTKFADRLEAERDFCITAAFGHDNAGYPELERVVVEAVGPMDDEMFSRCVSTLHAHPRAKRIVVKIDTRGGAPDVAQRIAASIAGHTAAKVAVVVGECCSAASYLLLACHKRLAVPGARFVLHRTEYDDAAGMTADQGASKRADDQIEIMMAGVRGIDEEKYRAALFANLEFDTQEALDFGLLTGIADDSDLALLRAEDSPRPIAPAPVLTTADTDDPEFYEGKTIGGEVVHFPFDAGVVRALRAAKGNLVLGLPSVYQAAAVENWRPFNV